MPKEFTIFALLYGNHPELAARCVSSIAPYVGDRAELRVGLNTVGGKTRKMVNSQAGPGGAISKVYDYGENILKYPMMRRMFHDPDAPIKTPYIMWFDDDSFVKPDASQQRPWLDIVSEAISQADMLGSVYSLNYRGDQHKWIAAQPWYAGKAARPKASFATGGWWCIRTEVVQQYNWPPEALQHRGGDVMLGELLRQQDRTLKQFRTGVAINANDAGQESKAARRGHDETPIGVAFVEPPAVKVVPPPPPPVPGNPFVQLDL